MRSHPTERRSVVVTGAGRGIGAAIRREVQQGLIKEVRIKGLDLVRPFHQVTHRGRPLALVSRAFLRFLNRAPRTHLWEPVNHS